MAGLSSAGARRVIELIITGDSAGAIRAIEAVSGAADMSAATLKKQGEAMQTVGRTALGLTAPLVAVGAVAGKMAMNFQQSMEMIHTQAGASQQEVNSLSKSVLNLAGHGVTQAPNELAQGLFHLESLGLRGAKAMDALKVAAEGAMVGQSSLEDTTTALGAAYFSGIRGAGNMNHVMGVLNATVGAGNMHMQDLIDAMKTGLLPAARLAGVSINNVMAAEATLADASGDAAGSGTRLATAMHFMYAPSKAAQEQLAGIGLSAQQLSSAMRGPQGLLGALLLLKQHLASSGGSAFQQQQVLNSLMPAGRGRVLETLLQLTDRYQMKLNQINQKSGAFSG